MDKLTKYRQIIRQILTPFKNDYYAGSPDLKNEIIFDSENDHYLVVTIGWDNEMPVRDCVFHLDIIGGKIWIQEDNTDADIASLLVDANIPKSDIVLGFQSPSMRPFTSFAAG